MRSTERILSMEPTPVCGISHEQSLSTASNRSLELLLAELGRNERIQPGTFAAEQEATITAILRERAASGVVLYDEGGPHHPV